MIPCRHSYVRRNAVLAINGLFKLPKGELLLPDAPELIEKARTRDLTCLSFLGGTLQCHIHDTIGEVISICLICFFGCLEH